MPEQPREKDEIDSLEAEQLAEAERARKAARQALELEKAKQTSGEPKPPTQEQQPEKKYSIRELLNVDTPVVLAEGDIKTLKERLRDWKKSIDLQEVKDKTTEEIEQEKAIEELYRRVFISDKGKLNPYAQSDAILKDLLTREGVEIIEEKKKPEEPKKEEGGTFGEDVFEETEKPSVAEPKPEEPPAPEQPPAPPKEPPVVALKPEQEKNIEEGYKNLLRETEAPPRPPEPPKPPGPERRPEEEPKEPELPTRKNLWGELEKIENEEERKKKFERIIKAFEQGERVYGTKDNKLNRYYKLENTDLVREIVSEEGLDGERQLTFAVYNEKGQQLGKKDRTGKVEPWLITKKLGEIDYREWKKLEADQNPKKGDVLLKKDGTTIYGKVDVQELPEHLRTGTRRYENEGRIAFKERVKIRSEAREELEESKPKGEAEPPAEPTEPTFSPETREREASGKTLKELGIDILEPRKRRVVRQEAETTPVVEEQEKEETTEDYVQHLKGEKYNKYLEYVKEEERGIREGNKKNENFYRKLREKYEREAIRNKADYLASSEYCKDQEANLTELLGQVEGEEEKSRLKKEITEWQKKQKWIEVLEKNENPAIKKFYNKLRYLIDEHPVATSAVIVGSAIPSTLAMVGGFLPPLLAFLPPAGIAAYRIVNERFVRAKERRNQIREKVSASVEPVVQAPEPTPPAPVRSEPAPQPRPAEAKPMLTPEKKRDLESVNREITELLNKDYECPNCKLQFKLILSTGACPSCKSEKLKPEFLELQNNLERLRQSKLSLERGEAPPTSPPPKVESDPLKGK